VPVIVITANDDGKLLKDLRRIGVDKYFIKPIDCDEVLKTVAQVTQKKV
jgi:response regulator of citrate/malate metabolism